MTARQPLTAAQRRLRAQIAAHTSHAHHDPRERTRAASAATPAQRPYWQRLVAAEHPELDGAEINRRAEHLHRAHMATLALRSSQARARRKASGTGDAA
ncbi:hypothetical protein [Frankia tisae]|uniref:hypothetical protein n=1 Tax=Frankia tisae TaxID=2950104 RepID=UPI0021C16E0B|nr:hypothetical protein [Frankia tisae]